MEINRLKPKNSVASGAYHPAVEVRQGEVSTLYVSGQGTVNPETGQRVLGPLTDQTVQVMDNLKNVVVGSGYDMDHVVKTTIFLTDMDDFFEVNAVYARYFKAACLPARSTCAVKELPGGQNVEIEAVAVKPASGE